jgi:hypothetical protein
MQIYLGISGKRHGPFTLDAVNRGIALGKVSLNGTLAWWDGCGEWRPLASVPGIIAPARSERMPPDPPSISVSEQVAPPIAPVPPMTTPNGDATGGVIPYKNAPALISYYLGILALLPILGFFFGIASLVLGVRGLRKRRSEPHVKGAIHAWIGIILGALSLSVHLLVIIILIIAATRGGR